jgi:NitT/TauT family transport system substrate-binding protein
MNRQRQTKVSTCVLLLGAMALTACSGDPEPATGSGTEEQFSTSIGVPGRTMTFAPEYLALDKGFFADEGVDVEIKAVTSANAVAAAINGDVPYVAALGSGIRAVVSGADLVAIASVNNVIPMRLIADSQYSSLEDLAGTVIGAGNTGSSTHLFALDLLAEHGVAEDEATFLSCMDEACLQSLLAGSLSAAVLQQPYAAMALDEGAVALTDVEEFYPEHGNGLLVSRQYLEDNREETVRVVAALNRAVEYLKDPANREENIAYFVDTFELSPELAEASFDDLVISLRDDASIDADGLQAQGSAYAESLDDGSTFDVTRSADTTVFDEATQD